MQFSMRSLSVRLRAIRLEAGGACAVVEVTAPSAVGLALLAMRREERVAFSVLLVAVGTFPFGSKLVAVSHRALLGWRFAFFLLRIFCAHLSNKFALAVLGFRSHLVPVVSGSPGAQRVMFVLLRSLLAFGFVGCMSRLHCVWCLDRRLLFYRTSTIRAGRRLSACVWRELPTFGRAF